MKKIIKASASGASYPPILNRDFDWMRGSIESFEGDNAESLVKFLEDMDFRRDVKTMLPHRSHSIHMSETWTLDTSAGKISVVFEYDSSDSESFVSFDRSAYPQGRVTKIEVIDEQDESLVRQEYDRIFNSTKSIGRRIVADEYYPENYSDLGYDGLDEAVKQFDELRSILSTILGELDEFAEEYDEWGGSTSTLEMFPGPDDAKAFADTFYNLNKEAENILESVLAELR